MIRPCDSHGVRLIREADKRIIYPQFDHLMALSQPLAQLCRALAAQTEQRGAPQAGGARRER
jgi:hypothetical protein